MADFYEMDFIRGILILVKVDEMRCTISCSQLATVYWSRDEGGIG